VTIRGFLAIAVAVVLAVACSGKGATRSNDPHSFGSNALTPKFPTSSATTSPASESSAAEWTTSADDGSTTSESSPNRVLGEVAFSDPVGDLTPSPVDPPPPWADLAGARLKLTASGWELRVKLGTTAPSTTDTSHTMNIASFYDVDADGNPDYQVWVNLADGGWGGAYFDDGPNPGPNRFGADSQVTITEDADEIVIRFPTSLLRGAISFRWSVASEWGKYQTIGTDLAARDDAPDNDQAVTYSP
jgi:hypothetical protein